MSIRTDIADKLVSIFDGINTTAGFQTNVAFVQRRLLFYDEIEVKPAVMVTGGSETRNYLPGQQKERIITYIVRAYINSDSESDKLLDTLVEDIESALDIEFYKDRLGGLVTNISVQEITTDEGLLAPDAVAEIVLAANII